MPPPSYLENSSADDLIYFALGTRYIEGCGPDLPRVALVELLRRTTLSSHVLDEIDRGFGLFDRLFASPTLDGKLDIYGQRVSSFGFLSRFAEMSLEQLEFIAEWMNMVNRWGSHFSSCFDVMEWGLYIEARKAFVG